MRNHATIICARNDHVLLVAKPGARWSLPGGKAEGAESWIDAVWHELEEETAMVASELMWLFPFGGANTVHYVSRQMLRTIWFLAGATKLRVAAGPVRRSLPHSA